MVLADSGRIARVPPYLGSPLGQSPVSATGLSPSVARLSRRLAYKELVLTAVPLPRPSCLGRFGLFRVRSPLLAESRFLSSPRGTEMFHFPRFARARLFVQRAVRRHYPPWVSPFGHLRIKAWLAAPRSLSQLPASFVASCRLGIHRVPFPAWSSSLLAPASAEPSPAEDQGPARSQNTAVNRRLAPVTLCNLVLHSSCAYAVVKDRLQGPQVALRSLETGCKPTGEELRFDLVAGWTSREATSAP